MNSAGKGAEFVGEGLGGFFGDLLTEGGAVGEFVGNLVSGGQALSITGSKSMNQLFEQGPDDVFKAAVHLSVALNFVVQCSSTCAMARCSVMGEDCNG